MSINSQDTDDISNYLDSEDINILKNECILVNGKMFHPFNFSLVQKYYSKLINTNNEVKRLFELFKNKNKNLNRDELENKFNSLFNYFQFTKDSYEKETIMTKENFYLTDEDNSVKVKLFYLNGYKNNYPELDYLGYLQGIQMSEDTESEDTESEEPFIWDTELKIIFSGKYYSQGSNNIMSKIENNIYMSSVGLDEQQVAINYYILHNFEEGHFKTRGRGGWEDFIKINSDEKDEFSEIEKKINSIPVSNPIIIQQNPLIRKVGRGGKKNTNKNTKKIILKLKLKSTSKSKRRL